ncbi:MAG: sugar metabolism transcriptional regulator, partial [Gammaproteobacteria bacterium]
QATLDEVAAYFAADRELVRGMLEVWQRKGKVTSLQAEKCRGCTQCGSTLIEVYQWQG